MKRIGIAASKMAKGSLVLYHCYVILISFLFSLFVFILAGASVLFALTIIAYVSNEILITDFEKNWRAIFTLCMIALSIVTGVFNLFAVLVNLKLPKITDKP